MSDLTAEARIEWTARALTRLGGYWRKDWNDFDGRTLRDQLGAIEAVLMGAKPPFDVDEAYGGHDGF